MSIFSVSFGVIPISFAVCSIVFPSKCVRTMASLSIGGRLSMLSCTILFCSLSITFPSGVRLSTAVRAGSPSCV